MVTMLQSSNVMAGYLLESLPQSHAICCSRSLPKEKMITVNTKRIHHFCQNPCKFEKDRVRSPSLLDVCCMSNLPESTIYGPKSQSPWKRITLKHLSEKYAKGEPITMVIAYYYPSAVHVDQAGIDICLVGDSAGMVVHGHDTTLPVSIEDMLLHCQAVARGARRPLLVGDLPFVSYEKSTEQAVGIAIKILKEGGMDAIKLEGDALSRVMAAQSIVEAGIAVMGHVGLTPQAINALGGFRPQGKTAESAIKVLESALALQDAGCFSIVLECMQSLVAAAVTPALQIPTIGIGAGPSCSGQGPI